MDKVTCIVFFVVAVSLGSIEADDDKKSMPKLSLDQITIDCAEKFDVSEEQFSKAIMSFDASGIAPCFWSCCFKKVDVLNSEGKYDVDATLELLKNMFFSKDDSEKIVEIVKKCESVNDESVSDGDAACERAFLITNCWFENGKKAFPMPFQKR
ncbi:uncharacterized protein LOC118267981 [Spodoptera frugiperda]|uniref:Uncharacterized protein LOC118267981 n=1 Tax=Spodoptera frugiperda TaxID=7108 RepID=A0A9R0D327_SPOFR|nr:uncharacterized protein LOC118267981 [Spodoptera frugiperda]